jgi:N-acetylglucosamine-6-phosphate deacetylase
MLDVVRWCVQAAGIPLLDAVTAASSTPSKTLALAGIGGLQAGNLADVVVVDNELSLHAVLRRGEWPFEDIL